MAQAGAEISNAYINVVINVVMERMDSFGLCAEGNALKPVLLE
jgi:hypothetical protein